MILGQSAVTIYNGYNVASSNYVYTSNASTGADDGWKNAKADYVHIQLCAATLLYGINYRIEGRNNTYTRKANIYNATISSSQSIDETVVITEKMKELRVGIKLGTVPASPAASPHNFHCGILLTEIK